MIGEEGEDAGTLNVIYQRVHWDDYNNMLNTYFNNNTI